MTNGNGFGISNIVFKSELNYSLSDATFKKLYNYLASGSVEGVDRATLQVDRRLRCVRIPFPSSHREMVILYQTGQIVAMGISSPDRARELIARVVEALSKVTGKPVNELWSGKVEGVNTVITLHGYSTLSELLQTAISAGVDVASLASSLGWEYFYDTAVAQKPLFRHRELNVTVMVSFGGSVTVMARSEEYLDMVKGFLESLEKVLKEELAEEVVAV